MQKLNLKKYASILLVLVPITASLIIQSCSTKEEQNPKSTSDKPAKIGKLGEDDLVSVTIPSSLQSTSTTNIIDVEEVLVFEDTLNKGNFVNLIAHYSLDTVNNQYGYFKVNEGFQNWLQANYGYNFDYILDNGQNDIYTGLKERPIITPKPGDNSSPENGKLKPCSESSALRKYFLGCKQKIPAITLPGGDVIEPEKCYQVWYLGGKKLGEKQVPC